MVKGEKKNLYTHTEAFHRNELVSAKLLLCPDTGSNVAGVLMSN